MKEGECQSNLHCKDGQNHDIVSHFSLQRHRAVVVRIIIRKSWIVIHLPHVFKPDPLFCMISPVTQYLKGLLSLQSPLITKSIRLLTFAFDFYLL